MKKNEIALLILSLCCIAGIKAQIGIQTESPLGIVHIDAAKDNSSAPTATQLLNDVIIDSNGNIGLGVSAPTARLEIADISSTSTMPLRIEDASTFSNKVLESVTSDGRAKWTQQPISYTQMYVANTNQYYVYAAETVLVLNNTITIPATGKYLITVRWWGRYLTGSATTGVISGYVYLYKNNSGTLETLDQIEYYQTAKQNDYITFTTSLYAGERVAGDILTLTIKPMIGGTTGNVWQSGPALAGTSTGYLPTVILYSI